MLNAQVKIKERVEINPHLSKTSKLQTLDDTPVCVHIDFTAGIVNWVRLLTCEGNIYGAGGHVSATTCCGTVDYQISYFDISPDAGEVEVPYHFTATLDDGTVLVDFHDYIHAFYADGLWGGSFVVNYPGDYVPTVMITNPPVNKTILMSQHHLPVITFEEYHTPNQGVDTPAITWNPSNILDTKDYFNQIQDTMSIRVKVTATNRFGEASDFRTVLLKKVEDVDHFDVRVIQDTIDENSVATIYATAKDKNGNETELDDNTSITVTANPDAVGSVWPSETDYGTIRNEGVYYIPVSPAAQSIQDVAITVKNADAQGTGKMVVEAASCLILSVGNKKISPGGKTSIGLKRLDSFGSISDYPSYQLFSIWMNTDEQYGRLRCISNSDEGSYVYGEQPFEFIAADSFDLDSTVVEIEAWTSSGGGNTASSIGIVTKDTLRMPTGLMLKTQTSNSKIRIADSIRAAVMERNTIRSFEKLRKRLYAIREKAKNKSQFDKIIAKMESRFASTNGVIKNTVNTPKPLAKAGQIAMSVEEGEYCEPPIAEVTIKKKPCEDAPQCTGSPTMPTITLKELKRPDMVPLDPCNPKFDEDGNVRGGGFKPLELWAKPFEDFVIQPCFNSETDNWQFSIPEITVKVYLDLCENNILGNGQVFINSISDIPIGDYCTALMDFKDHLNYPVGDAAPGPLPKRPLKYLIRPVFYNHEEIHKRYYEEFLNKRKPDFEKAIQSYKLKCDEAKNVEDIAVKAEEMIKKDLGIYLSGTLRDWALDTGGFSNDPDRKRKKDYNEQIRTQGSKEYREYLKTYIDALEKVAPYCIQ